MGADLSGASAHLQTTQASLKGGSPPPLIKSYLPRRRSAVSVSSLSATRRMKGGKGTRHAFKDAS